jgi:thymidylate kinase
MQIRVRERFGTLQQTDEQQGTVPWKIVDAAQTMEQVEKDIWNVVSEQVEQVKDKPVSKLWEK